MSRHTTYCFDENSTKEIYDYVKWFNIGKIGKTALPSYIMEDVNIKNINIVNIDRDNIKITYDIPIYTKVDSLFCFYRTISLKLRIDRKNINDLYVPIYNKGFNVVRDKLSSDLQITHINIQLISSSTLIESFSLTHNLYIPKIILLRGDEATARVRKIKIEEILK